jgi:DNA-binding response OmpR family regulator
MTRILVVDDDRELVKFLARVLQGEGWEVGAAYDGEEALRKVKAGEWDAVLLDIRMPKLDGLAALKLMRQYDPDFPVVLITGEAEQGDMMEAYRSGAYTCLVKPLDDQEVVRAVRGALERSQAGRLRAAPAPTEMNPASVDPKKKTKPLS